MAAASSNLFFHSFSFSPLLWGMTAAVIFVCGLWFLCLNLLCAATAESASDGSIEAGKEEVQVGAGPCVLLVKRQEMISYTGHLQLLRTSRAALISPLWGFPCVQSRRVCRTEDKSGSSGNSEALSSSAKFVVDPKLLPGTIPGVSREELAERMEKYQQELFYKASQAASRELTNEMDAMRRAMPPEEFQGFLRYVDALQTKNTKEMARLSAMSPQQLYRYQRRQQRWGRLQKLGKTLVLFVALFGCVFFIFFLFFFFN